MSNQKLTPAEARRNLAEHLDWQFAERNDSEVAQALYQGAPVDAVHTLDEAGLLDGFFTFLREHHILDHWQSFTIDGVYRLFLPALYFLLLYGTRILLGIPSTNALPELLFSNVALMELIGFNAYQVAQGMTQRGASQRTGARPYVLMDPQTLAKTICKASAGALERLFNGTLQLLAAAGCFPAEVRAAVDGTRIVTTPKYQGCGRLADKQRKRTRGGAWVEVITWVYGWRLIALVDLTTLIPLAIKIVQIQEHEAPHLLALVEQAQQNLAPHSRIVSLVVDRAYVDGPTLYALDQRGIIWTLMAKSNQDARATAWALSAEGHEQERQETVRHGQGRTATQETLCTRVVAVQGIRTWGSYRPPQEEVPRLAFADRPALNAVVIREWRNNLPDADTGPWVLLTNGPVADPWETVNAYDDRSWIENGLFRNSKQFWTLTRWFPQKDEAGVRTHLTFVMLMLATATAYRLWDKAQSETPDPPPSHLALPALPPSRTARSEEEPDPRPQLSHALLEGQGIARWRRELRRQNRDKLIVFVGEQYGIFDIYEFLILTGVPLRQLPPHIASPTDVLRRFGCLPETETDSNVKERKSLQDTIP
jgi:hypothetical protein